MGNNNKVIFFWFRRDLRLHDNVALFHALNQQALKVIPLFIFDTNILNDLKDKQDKRVTFIYEALKDLNAELKKHKSRLLVKHGQPIKVWKTLIEEWDIKAVYANHDYEPYAQERDRQVQHILENAGVSLYTFKDQVIFEKDEILKNDGDPYSIFTPYNKKWKGRLKKEHLQAYPSEKLLQHLYNSNFNFPDMGTTGFTHADFNFPLKVIDEEKIRQYDQYRDFPAKEGTTKLGIHLRFGTISIRQLVKTSQKLNETFLNELIWREFFMMIIWYFPNTMTKNYKSKYDGIQWRNNEKEFEAWCKGQTGYALVDAGMRELNETGYMHNRVRMVAASFLVKHLLIDWRWGEAYFAEKLLDYEMSSNVGNWQWVAGTGCDAAPYFRIFNPHSQLKKFDPDLKYVRKWVAEFSNNNYIKPIVEHKFARERALKAYKKAVN